jgi:hypothetical protein
VSSTSGQKAAAAEAAARRSETRLRSVAMAPAAEAMDPAAARRGWGLGFRVLRARLLFLAPQNNFGRLLLLLSRCSPFSGDGRRMGPTAAPSSSSGPLVDYGGTHLSVYVNIEDLCGPRPRKYDLPFPCSHGSGPSHACFLLWFGGPIHEIKELTRPGPCLPLRPPPPQVSTLEQDPAALSPPST